MLLTYFVFRVHKRWPSHHWNTVSIWSCIFHDSQQFISVLFFLFYTSDPVIDCLSVPHFPQPEKLLDNPKSFGKKLCFDTDLIQPLSGIELSHSRAFCAELLLMHLSFYGRYKRVIVVRGEGHIYTCSRSKCFEIYNIEGWL